MTALDKIHRHSVHRRCLLERSNLESKVALARLMPDLIARQLLNTPGAQGTVSGEVFFIQTCPPVWVQSRETSECYDALPVTYMKQSYFLQPTTRILTRYGAPVKCNPVAPPTFLLNGIWTARYPNRLRTYPPQVLAPSEDTAPSLHTIRDLAKSGIYSRKAIEELQHIFQQGQVRTALTHVLTMRAQGENAELYGFDFTRLYNEAQLQSLAHNLFSRIWSWLNSVNGISCSIIVIYWIVCGIKYLISVLLNAITLYRTVGVSSLLTAALWNSMTQYTLFHRPHLPTVNHIHRSNNNTAYPVKVLHRNRNRLLPQASNRLHQFLDHP